MDRTSFVLGPAAMQEIENANGHIFFDRATALDFADEFLFNRESAAHPLLFALVGACLSVGDKVDIKFGLTNPNTPEEEATVTEAGGKERLLWEVARRIEPISEEEAVRAYNTYRSALAAFKGVSQPERVSRPQSIPSNPPNVPETTYPVPLPFESLFHFPGNVLLRRDLRLNTRSRRLLWGPVSNSRPMRAFDPLILSALFTLAVGAPPLVFAVLQGTEGAGEIPESFGRTSYADAPDVQLGQGKVWIVG